MKLLVINSNMNREITDKIRDVARSLVNPGTTVDAVCAEWGVPAIEGNYDATFAALATVELVKRYEKDYDAFVIACYSDPGLYAARDLTNKPVYGIAQASMLAACSFGHRFSILSPLNRFRPVLESLVRYYGLESLCASVRTVNMDVKQSFNDLKAANTAFALEARRAVKEDGAEVICLGGAVFAGRDHVIGEEAGGVICIDGLSAALKQAEAYHALGYTSSKVGLFETPRLKTRTLPGGAEI
ncbi:MAG: hypothetical protein GX256_02070 [Fretibacterium sp.]|nr:hypothetical protein [Fretibacterium sp.]